MLRRSRSIGGWTLTGVCGYDHEQRLHYEFGQREEVIRMLYLPSEQGQGIVEYALLLALVTIVVIVILALLGPAIGNVFSNLYANV